MWTGENVSWTEVDGISCLDVKWRRMWAEKYSVKPVYVMSLWRGVGTRRRHAVVSSSYMSDTSWQKDSKNDQVPNKGQRRYIWKGGLWGGISVGSKVTKLYVIKIFFLTDPHTQARKWKHSATSLVHFLRKPKDLKTSCTGHKSGFIFLYDPCSKNVCFNKYLN